MTSDDNDNRQGDGEGHVNRVSFTLPDLPPSCNLIYGPERSIYSPTPQWTIKTEWRLWQSRISPTIPKFKKAPNSIIRIDRVYLTPYFYKNGNWRRMDVTNMDKLLFDTIAKKCRWDDLFVKQGTMDSYDDEANVVEVTLTEITETEWRGRQR